MHCALISGINDQPLPETMTMTTIQSWAAFEHFPMSQVNEAFEHLRSGKARYRSVLDADFRSI